MKSTAAYKKSRAQRTADIAALEEQSENISTGGKVAKQKLGRPLSRKTDKMTIVMDPAVKQRLKEYCVKNQTTAAELIDSLIHNFFRNQ